MRSAQLELASAAAAAESALAEVQAGGEARAEGLRQELASSNTRRAELEARLQVGQARWLGWLQQLLQSSMCNEAQPTGGQADAVLTLLGPGVCA